MTRPRTLVVITAAAAAPSALLAQPRPGGAGGLIPGELVLSIYGGKSLTFDSHLSFRAPGGTDVTYEHVGWEDDSFDAPPFYGVRLGYWLESGPQLGFCLDFTHCKTILNSSQITDRTGSIGGTPVSGPGPISESIQSFEMSHGNNSFTFNVMYRWFLGEGGRRDGTFFGRLQPYVGVGAGVAIPHVEASVNGVTTSDYQWAGPAAQGFLGANYDLAGWGWGSLSMFAEYKLTHVNVDLNLVGGSSIRTSTLTNQFIVGLSLAF